MCPPFVECPARFTGLLAYQALARCSAARLAGGALVILTVLSAGAPSHCSSHKLWQLQLAPTGARPARPEWAQRSAPIRITLGGVSLLPDLERYYESSVPDSLAGPSGSPVLPKTLMLTLLLLNVSIISDHEDPSRASGFHSHHHIEVGNSSCSAIRTWSPYHGEGKVTL